MNLTTYTSCSQLFKSSYIAEHIRSLVWEEGPCARPVSGLICLQSRGINAFSFKIIRLKSEFWSLQRSSETDGCLRQVIDSCSSNVMQKAPEWSLCHLTSEIQMGKGGYYLDLNDWIHDICDSLKLICVIPLFNYSEHFQNSEQFQQHQ